MKKSIACIIIICTLIIFAGCGGGGGGSASNTPVTISLSFQNDHAGSLNLKVLPLTHVRYTVTGPKMNDMQGTVPVIGAAADIYLMVPSGQQRIFTIQILDSSGVVAYYGNKTVDLTGDPITIEIPLNEIPPVDQTSIIGSFPLFTPDPNDTEALAVVQTIPPHNSTGIDPNVTISIFFNDEIDPMTINDQSIQVKDSKGDQQFGTYSGSLSSAGNTILNFKPFAVLSEGDTITLTMFKTNGIKDDGGNTLSSDFIFSFQTKQQSVAPADLGFEQGATGWNFSGDGTILSSPKDDISAYEGNYMAAISSGANFGGQALDNRTSILTSGPVQVPPGKQYISFNYDFISEEFDEFVDSEFDDVFKISLSGPLGSYSELVTSVNIVGIDNSYPVDFAGLNGPEHTGWLTKTINISSLGSPIIISFELSDVGDLVVTSVAVIDNINFQ